jgi:hypothetical protein
MDVKLLLGASIWKARGAIQILAQGSKPFESSTLVPLAEQAGHVRAGKR